MTPPATATTTPSAPGASAAPGAAPLDLSVFSAPIAAARLEHTDFVAGLVVADQVVRVVAMADGKPTWAANALTGVHWAPDAELHMRPAGEGVALVWREPQANRVVRKLVLLGPHGELRGEPVEIGASFCTTADGAAWIDPRPTGAARVLARRWSDPTAREVIAVSSDRDPALVCGDHAVFVLGDGDDDLTAASFVPGEAAEAPRTISRDSDFGDDDEREHDAYAVGDDLVFVRLGDSGAVALRDVPRGRALGPWRKLKQTIPSDDDVVAVDGDADATLVVFTHDADEACPGIGSTSESVRVLRADRKAGTEAVLDLAPPDCAHSLGPFWIARSPKAATVAWVDRATALGSKAPAVAGVALRTLAPGGTVARRVDAIADAVSDGGCDDRGCSFAALMRPTGGDGMQPETIAVLPYP
jgi:hypothetical protein